MEYNVPHTGNRGADMPEIPPLAASSRSSSEDGREKVWVRDSLLKPWPLQAVWIVTRYYCWASDQEVAPALLPPTGVSLLSLCQVFEVGAIYYNPRFMDEET